MNLELEFFQVSKLSEDQKKGLHQKWKTFFPRIQVKTKKKRLHLKSKVSFPKFCWRTKQKKNEGLHLKPQVFFPDFSVRDFPELSFTFMTKMDIPHGPLLNVPWRPVGNHWCSEFVGPNFASFVPVGNRVFKLYASALRNSCKTSELKLICTKEDNRKTCKLVSGSPMLWSSCLGLCYYFFFDYCFLGAVSMFHL